MVPCSPSSNTCSNWRPRDWFRGGFSGWLASKVKAHSLEFKELYPSLTRIRWQIKSRRTRCWIHFGVFQENTCFDLNSCLGFARAG